MININMHWKKKCYLCLIETFFFLLSNKNKLLLKLKLKKCLFIPDCDREEYQLKLGYYNYWSYNGIINADVYAIFSINQTLY